jgi:uncharacterized membrane protein YjfL (UPF0719 family)
MTKTISIISGFILSFALILLENSNFVAYRSPLYNFISVIAYSIFGTTILFSAYRFIDWLIEADIEAEIFEKQNLAAAIFKGLLLLGIAVIIAAVIVSP